MHCFQNMSSASGGFDPRLALGLRSRTPLGEFRPQNPYTVSQKCPPFYFSNDSVQKLTEILSKFDTNSLCITLPYEIPKSDFLTVLFKQTSNYYVISEETNYNCTAFQKQNCLVI